MTIAEQKAAMRAQARARRATFDAGSSGEQLSGHVLRDLVLSPHAVVAGFWPLPGEIDLRPLLCALHARGHGIVLPETPPRGSPLSFRQWQPGCPMVPGRFGTVRPEGPLAIPSVIFVPLLAFDRAGHRLGYGGGYYDRTLAAHPGAVPVGVAFAAQEVERVPVEPHDQTLDRVATDRGIVVINK